MPSHDKVAPSLFAHYAIRLGATWLMVCGFLFVALMCAWRTPLPQPTGAWILGSIILALLGGSLCEGWLLISLHSHLQQIHQELQGGAQDDLLSTPLAATGNELERIHAQVRHLLAQITNLSGLRKNERLTQRRLLELQRVLAELNRGNWQVRAVVGEDATGRIGEELNRLLERLSSALLVSKRLQQQLPSLQGQLQENHVSPQALQNQSLFAASLDKAEDLALHLERLAAQLQELGETTGQSGQFLSKVESHLTQWEAQQQEQHVALRNVSNAILQAGERSRHLAQLVEQLRQGLGKMEMVALNLSLEATRSSGGETILLLGQQISQLARQISEDMESIATLGATLDSELQGYHLKLQEQLQASSGHQQHAEQALAKLQHTSEQVSHSNQLLTQLVQTARQRLKVGTDLLTQLEGLAEQNETLANAGQQHQRLLHELTNVCEELQSMVELLAAS